MYKLFVDFYLKIGTVSDINFSSSLYKYTINTQHSEERNYPYFHEDMIQIIVNSKVNLKKRYLQRVY